MVGIWDGFFVRAVTDGLMWVLMTYPTRALYDSMDDGMEWTMGFSSTMMQFARSARADGSLDFSKCRA